MFVHEVEMDETKVIVTLSTGAKILCSKIPGLRLRAFQRSHQAPPPPKKMVTVIGGKQMLEPNPSDPAYLARLKVLEDKMAWDFLNIALGHMVLLDETEEQAEYRAALAESWGLNDDPGTWVEAMAFPEDEEEQTRDVEKLCTELMKLSSATASEVAAAKDRFRSDVDGDAGDESGNAPESS